MTERKLPLVEGALIKRPPMFSGVNYQLWKVRMKIFIKSINSWIWNAIMNGPFVPMTIVDGIVVENPLDEFTDVESKKAQYDCITIDIITFVLNLDEFSKVS